MPQRIIHAGGTLLDFLPFGVAGTGLLAAVASPVAHSIASVPPEAVLLSGVGALLAGAGRFIANVMFIGPAKADAIRADADYRRAEARQLEADARRCMNAPTCETYSPIGEDEEESEHPKVRYQRKRKQLHLS